MNHEYWMKQALQLAQMAGDLGEVPVGALVVQEGQVLGAGYNRREIDRSGTAHAELLAMAEASRRLQGWRLAHATLYVTLEPCPMCAGAIINSRIPRVVYGASDPKAGCFGSLTDFSQLGFNHRPQIISGILKEPCSQILTDFFRQLRQK